MQELDAFCDLWDSERCISVLGEAVKCLKLVSEAIMHSKF